MELTNENNFDPIPKLNSSPVPILFIPFNNEKLKCNNCRNKYSNTQLYKQKYCKKCLLSYIENIMDNNIYFDVNILTNNSQCIEHESTRNINFFTRKIQEWCKNCSEISYFKNYYDHINTKTQYIFIEKDCKLCGKLIDKISFGFKVCSNCYLISSGWTKSNFTNRSIPILYLPWWDASNKSSVCNHNLKFITDCQKWCSDCFIVYVGCRYCLTTNIIFGITDQTQCKKCKRISNIVIDITNISSGNHNIDEFLISTRTNIDRHHKIANYMNDMNKNSDPLNVYRFIEHELKINTKRTMEWIPYSQIKNSEKIAEGGFGIIYKATWFKTLAAVKRFSNSHDISKYFLNELKSLHRCYDTLFIIKYYGITQDPAIKDYMLIMEYASGGNLHNYLRENFANIKWITKLAILCQISDGLKTIHNENFIHRDFHSGNILSLKDDHKKCWDSDSSKRPSIIEIKEIVDNWYNKCKKNDELFTKAENKRLELVESKQIGPEKQHPGVVYNSQSLNSFISQVSSSNSSLTNSKQSNTSEEFDIYNTKCKLGPADFKPSKSLPINTLSGYKSTDLDFDIDKTHKSTQRLSTMNINSISHNISHSNVIYASRPLSVLISNIKNDS
ncbi:unnamed protein product [Rhizophagus irregularis]|nr:unnamed protein product [Rhizophagus irregularis]